MGKGKQAGDDLVRALAAKANDSLKVDGARAKIEVLKGGLRLRVFAVPQPGSDRTEPYWQRVNFGHPRNRDGVRAIKALALAISVAMQHPKSFDWGEFGVGAPRGDRTIGQLCEQFEAHYFSTRKLTKARGQTWKDEFRAVFKTLPQHEDLTAELAIAAVKTKAAESRQRKRWCDALGQLCKFAGISIDLKPYRQGTGKVKTIDPEAIPEDAQIDRWLRREYPVTKKRDSRLYRWAFAVIAAFGLRPHEVLAVKEIYWEPESKTYVAIVGEKTKTGGREVHASRPDLVEEFDLCTLTPPPLNQKGDRSNKAIGTSLGQCWRELVPEAKPYRLYSMRHAHGMRCEEMGLDPAIVAAEMGHSLAIHLRYYSQRRRADRQRAFAKAFGDRDERADTG